MRDSCHWLLRKHVKFETVYMVMKNPVGRPHLRWLKKLVQPSVWDLLLLLLLLVFGLSCRCLQL